MMRNCLLLLLMCVTHALYSQSGYTYREYTTENGMPSNGIRDMHFDSITGFLWLATEAGLARFNGNEFRLYNEGSGRQNITGRMAFMLPDTDGEMYVADMQSRLFRIEKHAPVFFDSGAKYPGLLSIGHLLYVSQKMYESWAKTKKPSSIDLYLYLDKVLPMSDTAALAINEDDALLYYYSLSNPDPRLLPLPINTIVDFFMIGKHCFLTDVNKNIYELDQSTLTIKKARTGFTNSRSDLIFWQKATKDPVYISGNAVYTIRMENGTLQRDLVCDSLPLGISMRFVQYNKAIKTLFIATTSNGLVIIRENSVEAVRRPLTEINVPESYYAQLLLPNGNIFVNSNQQLGKNPAMKNTPIKGGFSNHIYTDGDSILWFWQGLKDGPLKPGTYLRSHNNFTGRTTTYTKSAIDIPVPYPMQKSGGSLYTLTSYGLYKLQGDSMVLADDRFCKPSADPPSGMTEVKPGVLGLVTRDYVFLYDIHSRKIDTILVNKTADIRSLWVYGDYLFIGTYGAGIYIHHNGKTKAIPVDKNKHLLFAHCFVKDEYGYCWISSNSGLFKARLSDMIHAFESNHTADEVVYYHYYGKNDGMAITEMNGGCTPCAIIRQDKTISFPTMLGLLWVNPSFAKPGVLWSDIYIDAFSANRVNIHIDSLRYKELPSNTKEIRLKIAYPVWENPENIYIQYRFADDSTWKWLEPGGNILLISPGYGPHTLELRKINGFDTENITLMYLHFTVATPFYATWWFYALMGLLCLGSIYAYIRIRTRQYIFRQRKLENLIAEKTKELQEQNIELEKRDTIKTRLISIINHDIISPLKFLADTGKTLKEKRSRMDEKMVDETINEMVDTSKELQALSTNILNWIKYQSEGKGLVKENFVLHHMISDILKVLNPVAHRKQLTIANHVDPQLQVYQYYDPLKVLIYNLVSNSIKFTKKGTVTIDCEVTDKQVTILVSDQGMGMTQTQVQNLLMGKTDIHSAKNNPGTGHGLGYRIISDLLAITDATIAIESEQGKGTDVLVKFMN
ncbi:MAG: ATP-binding protein [Bacteroidota bacterium]